MTALAPSPCAPDCGAKAEADVITVVMGRAGVAHEGTLLRTVGLGSRVAVIIFAPQQRLVGLAHCMLPDREAADDPPTRFVDTAVPALIDELHSAGGAAPYAAALVGGACMFPGVSTGFVRDIAGSNLERARAALAAAAVPVRVEDVGGSEGRSVIVDPATQRVMVHTMRGGDRWL